MAARTGREAASDGKDARVIAEFTIAANDVVRFHVEPDAAAVPPLRLTYRHSCCPFGWGTIFQLRLQRIYRAKIGDPTTDVAVYEIVSSRSEKP